MSIELKLQLKSAEGALIRTLGTIERRGFTLGSVQAREHNGGIELKVAVDAHGRSVEVLIRQLKRLYDVCDASFTVGARAFALPQRDAAPAPSRRALSFFGIPGAASA